MGCNTTSDIDGIAVYGDEPKPFRLAEPNRGDSGYQIMIDKFYHGTLSRMQGEWVAHLNAKSNLTNDDILILVEMIIGVDTI